VVSIESVCNFFKQKALQLNGMLFTKIYMLYIVIRSAVDYISFMSQEISAENAA
jgi:hypothetical protein